MTNEEILAVLKNAKWQFNLWRDENDYPFGDGDIGINFAIHAVEHEQYLADLRDWRDNGRVVTGWLLEICSLTGEWSPFELDLNITFEDCDTDFDMQIVSGTPCDRYNNADLSDTWAERLGVKFSKHTTPLEDPHEIGVWGGVAGEGTETVNCATKGSLWRVKSVSFKCYLNRHVYEYAEEHSEFKISHI